MTADNDGRYFYGMGVEALEAKKYEEAIIFFKKSTLLQEHFKTYHLLYKALVAVKEFVDAKAAITHAYKLSPENDRVAFDYAEVCYEEGKHEAARNILEGILKRNSSFGPAKRLLSKLP